MSTPIHGSGAILYMSPGTGAAIPLAEQTDYSIELDADIADASSLGQTWGSSVKGMNKWTGSASGNFDTSSDTLWQASISVNAQKFYLYPLATAPTRYYYGMCFVRLGKAIGGGVAAKATTSISLSGQGELSRN